MKFLAFVVVSTLLLVVIQHFDPFAALVGFAGLGAGFCAGLLFR